MTQVSLTQQKLRQYVSSLFGSFLTAEFILFFNSSEADWTDDGRDVVNFILHFLPPVATTYHNTPYPSPPNLG